MEYEMFDGTMFCWEDYITPPDELHMISLFLDYYCDHKRIPTNEKMADLLFPKRNVKSIRRIKGRHLSCCGIAVPRSYRFCTQCGKAIENAEDCEFERDLEETVFICRYCGMSMGFDEEFCGLCGKRKIMESKSDDDTL